MKSVVSTHVVNNLLRVSNSQMEPSASAKLQVSNMEFKPPKDLLVNEDIANNWRLFKQKFDIYLKASGCGSQDDGVKVAMLLNCIGDDALEAFNTFDLSAKDKEVYEKVIQAFDVFCEPRKNITYNRFQFFSRRQREGESFDHFLTDLKRLAKQCEFREETSLIRDLIVIGVSDASLQERLLRDSDLKLNDAISQCRASECSKQQIQILQGNSNEICALNRRYNVNRRFHNDEQNCDKTVSTKSVSPNIKQGAQSTRSSNSFKCGKCNRTHGFRECPAFGKSCNTCGNKNHFAVVCRHRSVRRDLHECHTDETFVQEKFRVDTVSGNSKSIWTENIQLENNNLTCKLDTGAQCNVLPLKVFHKFNLKAKLEPNSFRVLSYCNKELPTIGSVTVDACVRNRLGTIKFVVVDTDNMPILGLNTCVKLNLIKRLDVLENSGTIWSIHPVNSNLVVPAYTGKKSLIEGNVDVFEGVGKFPDILKLELKDNSVPVINPVRRVPESVKPKLKATLDRLVGEGIIEPVNQPTDWVNNIVIVEKPNKSLRICLDPAHLNRCLKMNPYPIPSASELELLLRGKKYFSVLDMKDGFHHIELDSESRLVTSFITPFGKYMYRKLPFGLSVSPEIFQRYNNKVFGDIPNLGIYFDDFIIATDTEKEHDQILNKLLQRARENNIKFNPDKLQFKVSTVKYLGQVFSQKGVQPDPDRVEAILALQEPRNKKELQSVLGAANFLCKFIPNLSDITAPLRQLLKKDVDWNWSNSQSEAFAKLKCKIQEATTLRIFDPSVPAEIFVDASNYALGACLMQNKHPVAFSSRTFTSAETRYPVIDKEMAAICFAVSKYHNYVYGNVVTVYTDHKPILGIMDKSMFNVSGRLQKLKVKLLNYNLNIKYLPGKDNVVADLLSRFSKVAPVENENILDKSVVVHSLSNQLNMSDQKKQEFRLAINSDPVLSRLKEYVQKGWPDKNKLMNLEERMYFKLRNNIFYEDGLLFLGPKVLVPEKLRQCMLNLIHEAHLGVNKCKARARSILYWPKMSTDIEAVVLSCKICEKFRFKNGKEPLLSHPLASRPWERISCDLFDFGGANYLTVIDSYSNWIELEQLANKSAHCVIEKLKSIFSRFGVPDYFLSDNVPFCSSEFKSFANNWNFQSITSSPHYPRCNGLAEKSVSICKSLLRRSASSHKDLAFFLLEYRNSPLNRVNASPAQLFLNRMLKSKLPTTAMLLKPTILHKVCKNNTNEFHYNKSARPLSKFESGSNVLVRKFGPCPTWVPGEIVCKLEAPRSYMVRDEYGKEYRRNRTMLRKSLNKAIFKTTGSESNYCKQDDNTNVAIVNPGVEGHDFNRENLNAVDSPGFTEVNHEEVVIPTSRVGRSIRRPAYLKDYV